MHTVAGMLINLTYIKVKLLVFLLLLACCLDQALFQIMVNWVCDYSFQNFTAAWVPGVTCVCLTTQHVCFCFIDF